MAMAIAMTMKNATKPAEPLHAHAPVEDFKPTDSLFPTEFSSGHPWGTPAEIRESSESPISLFRRFDCNGQAKEKPGRKILRIIIHDSPPLVNPTARKKSEREKGARHRPLLHAFLQKPFYKKGGKSSPRLFTNAFLQRLFYKSLCKKGGKILCSRFYKSFYKREESHQKRPAPALMPRTNAVKSPKSRRGRRRGTSAPPSQRPRLPSGAPFRFSQIIRSASRNSSFSPMLLHSGVFRIRKKAVSNKLPSLPGIITIFRCTPRSPSQRPPRLFSFNFIVALPPLSAFNFRLLTFGF